MSWTPNTGIYMDAHYNLVYPKGATHLDGVDREAMEVIHEHWGSFPPQHPLINHVVGICFFFLWIVNFFGNGSVCYIFLKVKNLRTPSNMFVVNLAFSDLCMMTTMGLPVIINSFTQRYWMWGAFGCRLYGCLGAIFGTCSILTMVVIGYDRYNVIVKGFSGKKITPGMAFIILTLIWTYAVVICSTPFLGWGDYMVEGLLITCSYDFLSPGLNERTFILFAYIFNYFTPLLLISVFYYSIVKAVVAHEAALKAQAKKMNVDSLRSAGKDNEESAEVKIAKVAITNVLLWFTIWTPYAAISALPALGYQSALTPLLSQLPSFMAKTASCINPIVYAVSHPKFREAMAKELPCFGIGEKPKGSDNATTVQETTESC